MIWTTTPWTIPGNRAIAYSPKVAYGLYRVTSAPEGNWAAVGARYVLADSLASDVFGHARFTRSNGSAQLTCPALVSAAVGIRSTGSPVDTLSMSPSSWGITSPTTPEPASSTLRPVTGGEDFELWTSSSRGLAARGIDPQNSGDGRRKRRFHERSPALRGQAGHQRQGRKGRCERGGRQGFDRGGILWREVGSSMSTRMAGALRSPSSSAAPRNGSLRWTSRSPSRPSVSRIQRTRGAIFRFSGHFAKSGADCHRRNTLGAIDWREPHQGHGFEQARLGAFAPARRACRWRFSRARADTKSCSTKK